jgi:hypothetical protein
MGGSRMIINKNGSMRKNLTWNIRGCKMNNVFVKFFAIIFICYFFITCTRKEDDSSAPTTPKSARTQSGTEMTAWLKAIDENNFDNVLSLFDRLTSVDIEELTTNHAAEREAFSYDLNKTGDGVVIKKFNGSYEIYPAVIIPKTIEDYPVVEIAGFAQSGVSIMTVVIPNTIKKSSYGTNFSQYIHKINFPEGLEAIDSYVFRGSSITGELVIPNSVKEIGREAFLGCKNLTSIKFGTGINKIEEDCFGGTSISELVFPDNIETIGIRAFKECISLEKITFSKNIKSVGGGAFYGCIGLSEIIIPDEVTIISWSPVYITWENVFTKCGVLKLASRKKVQDLGYQGDF